MSEVKRYWVPQGVLADQSGWHPDDNEVVLAGEHDTQLTALREELAEANRQIELRDELGCMTCGGDGHVHRIDGEYLGPCTACLAYEFARAKRSLADAERRNAVMADLLRVCGMEFSTSEANAWEIMMREKINAALNKPEEAKS